MQTNQVRDLKRNFRFANISVDFDIKADVGFSIVGGLETYLRPRVPLYDDMSVLQEKLFKALKPFMLVTCKIIRAESSGMRLQLKHVHVEDVLLDCLEEVNVVVRFIFFRSDQQLL